VASVMTKPLPASGVPNPKEIPDYPGDVMIKGKGAAVGTWMYALRRRGYDLGDAVFGPGTLKCVRDWQSKHGLQVDGIAGRKTMRSLWEDPQPPGPGEAPPYRKSVKQGDKGVAVGDLYLALRRRGYSLVDAVFGPNMNNCIQDWQGKHGIERRPVGDQKTWHSLWHDK
jgi:peptidoglycan hydrolase-like protein with peptidoglycan-binding domain